MTEFDPQIIKEHADRLYRRSALLPWSHAVVGYVIGTIFGTVVGGATMPEAILARVLMVLVNGVAFAVIGYISGSQRALDLKLRAQTALLQLKIEENTRPK